MKKCQTRKVIYPLQRKVYLPSDYPFINNSDSLRLPTLISLSQLNYNLKSLICIVCRDMSCDWTELQAIVNCWQWFVFFDMSDASIEDSLLRSVHREGLSEFLFGLRFTVLQQYCPVYTLFSSPRRRLNSFAYFWLEWAGISVGTFSGT